MLKVRNRYRRQWDSVRLVGATHFLVTISQELFLRVARAFQLDVELHQPDMLPQWSGLHGGLMLLRRCLYPINKLLNSGFDQHGDAFITAFHKRNLARSFVCSKRLDELLMMAHSTLKAEYPIDELVEKVTDAPILLTVWRERIEREFKVSSIPRQAQLIQAAYEPSTDTERDRILSREYAMSRDRLKVVLSKVNNRQTSAAILSASQSLYLRSFLYACAAPNVWKSDAHNQSISLHRAASAMISETVVRSILTERLDDLRRNQPADFAMSVLSIPAWD